MDFSNLTTSDLYKAASLAEGYTSVPVDIDTFIDNEYYLGQTYGSGVYPYWRKALREIFPNPLYSPYMEICITGAIGVGKTTLSIIGVLYDLYRVTLLKDPHKKYKLINTTPIVISFITATLGLGQSVLMNQVYDAIGASPYFNSITCTNNFGKLKGENMFPHNVGVAAGSRASHSLGKAVIGAVVDEANFQAAVGNQAVENYTNIRRRMFSRFMTEGGSLPAHMWVVSSRNESTSFLESHIEAERNNPMVKIYEPAIWEVQEYKGIYSGKTFPVFTGSDLEQPRILYSPHEVDQYPGQIVNVPIEYLKDFENNLPGALKDLAGVASRSSSALIYNASACEAALALDNCMKKDEIQLTLDGTDQIEDFLEALPDKTGTWYAHLDGALKGDRFGFALSRVTKQIAVTRTSAIDGTDESRISPEVETPLLFGIKALPGSEVPLWKVRKFLVSLRNKGLHIALITCDGFQSADMLQLLNKLGFNARYDSVDRTKDAYLKLASNVTLGLHKMARSRILKNELLNLQNYSKKIDHPDEMIVDGIRMKGSKDIADAVAASSYNAILSALTLGTASMTESMRNSQTHLRTNKDKQAYVMKNFFGIG